MKADDAIDALHHWYDAQNATAAATNASAASRRREHLGRVGAATTDIGGTSDSGSAPVAATPPPVKALRDWASRLVE